MARRLFVGAARNFVFVTLKAVPSRVIPARWRLNLTALQQAQNWATGSTFQSDIGTFSFTTFTVRYNSRGVSAGQ